jgi:hypothetical protein
MMWQSFVLMLYCQERVAGFNGETFTCTLTGEFLDLKLSMEWLGFVVINLICVFAGRPTGMQQ